jgi:hypothetical protein
MPGMVLARAWRRRLYASVGMTLVVPVALLVSLTVLALSGGVPGLGALGEAFSGPSVSPVAAPVLGGQAAGSRTGRLITSRSGTVALAGSGAARTAGSGSLTRAPGRSPGTAGPGGSGGLGRTGSGGGGGSARGGGGSYSGSGPSGRAPSPRPTAVDRIVGTVTPVTSKLPAPVGPTVTRALRSGEKAADRVLKQLPGL